MGRNTSFALAMAFATAVVSFFSGSTVKAYTPTLSPGGLPVRWKGDPKLNLAGNPKNQVGISDQQLFASVVKSLQRWKFASEQTVQFDYWQGSDPNVYSAKSEYDGLSSIYFASNEKGSSRLSPNVLGLTQVWYDTNSGAILETDIVLNDRDFQFTTDARDTSGYGSGNYNATGGKSRVFIENVLTHELGHALGLSHSGGLNSTMLFMESPEQAFLGCDEGVAIKALYPGSDAGARGSITGTVLSPDGSPVFGAHVVAISRKRGTVLATGITDKSGKYIISALEPGSYFLMAEPFFAGAQTLPTFYSSIKTEICSGARYFGRTFLTSDDGSSLKSIEVSGGGSSVSASEIRVQCADGGAAVVAVPASSRLTSAPTAFDGTSGKNGFGIADRLSQERVGYYRLKSVNGRLEVHALSYSLYSPVRPTLTLLDSAGNEISARIAEEVYEGVSGFVNYDAALTADNLPFGEYVIRISVSPLDATLYPAGPVALDSVPFVVLTGSVNDSAPPLSSALANNARCRMSEAFPAYVSPAGDPPRGSGSSQGEESVGFCGTIQIKDPPKAGGGDWGRGPGVAAIVGWFLPWGAMVAILRGARRRSRA